MASKKEVAVVEERSTALATFDVGGMVGDGSEGTTQDQVSIPFINLLQPLSPQVSGDNPVDGAKSGDFYIPAIDQLIPGKTGFLFQPCHRENVYVEWVPKDAGGGFVAKHEPNSDVVLEAIANNNGSKYGDLKVGSNELVQTSYIYGAILTDEGDEVLGYAVLPFWSTKLKTLRPAWTQFSILKVEYNGKKVMPPLYAMRWRVTSKSDKDKKGRSFANYAIDAKALPGMFPPKTEVEMELLTAGQTFYQQLKSGAATADMNQHVSEAPANSADSDVPF